jgi:urease accessory protein
VNGALHLVCGLDSTGRTALVRQYVSAPMHISKPWWDDGLLVVNAINSTAGLFSGDSIDTNIEVQAGAQMLLTSPSASRAYRMPSGMATLRQSIRVARSAWLEMLPSIFIPHAGSHYSQETSIHLEPGARCLWFETFTPGRVASGEAWQFTRFENRFLLTLNSRPIARETYSITPNSPSIRALRDQFPTGCHATCYAAGADFPDDLLAAISTLHNSDCWIGATRLDAPAIAVRLVAANNIHLSRALTKIRALIHHAFNRPLPDLRRS